MNPYDFYGIYRDSMIHAASISSWGGRAIGWPSASKASRASGRTSNWRLGAGTVNPLFFVGVLAWSWVHPKPPGFCYVCICVPNVNHLGNMSFFWFQSFRGLHFYSMSSIQRIPRFLRFEESNLPSEVNASFIWPGHLAVASAGWEFPSLPLKNG